MKRQTILSGFQTAIKKVSIDVNHCYKAQGYLGFFHHSKPSLSSNNMNSFVFTIILTLTFWSDFCVSGDINVQCGLTGLCQVCEIIYDLYEPNSKKNCISGTNTWYFWSNQWSGLLVPMYDLWWLSMVQLWFGILSVFQWLPFAEWGSWGLHFWASGMSIWKFHCTHHFNYFLTSDKKW